jgi:uncharacterized protein YndB with AHSA1/START domain
MSAKKAKNVKKDKPAKGKSVAIAKKAKAKKPAPASVKTTVQKKVVKGKSSNKNNSAKSAKVLTKGKKTVKKQIIEKVKEKVKLTKPKPVKALKKVVKKETEKKIIKKVTSPKKETVAEDKSLKVKKNKVAEGIELNKIKSANTASKPKRSKKKKKGDDDDEPIIDVEDALLAEILETVKPKKKNNKEPKQIRTFVNPMASLTVAKTVKEGVKGKSSVKEPKGKFVLEFVIGTSRAILYEFLTTPSGLSEWFADDVNIHDGVFTFYWDGSEQKALLLDFKEEQFIRFQWMDKPEGSYFEFKIEIDDLTGDVSLMVTDFADEGSDLETSKRLWDSQIHTLMHVIGSY